MTQLSTQKNHIKNQFGFWIVLLYSGILRVIGIGFRPIWYDESIAILRARAGIDGIFQAILGQDPSGIIADQHPPGFFLSLWAWIEVFGDSVISTRILSILFGLITVVVIYLLGLEFLGEKKAWVPAFFLAISAFHIHYSQEIRMYSMMVAFLTIATYAMAKGFQKSRWYWWVLFAVSSAAAQYCHHLAGIYLICLALIPVFKLDWRTIKNTVLGGLGAVLLFSPWLINLPRQIESTHTYWTRKPDLTRFLTLLLTYFSGNPYVSKFKTISLFSILVVIVFCVMISYRIMKLNRETTSKQGIWAAYLAFIPVVVLWIISQFWPVYVERAVITSGVFFAVWVGWNVSHDLANTFERGVIIGLMVFGSILGIRNHLFENNTLRTEWEEIGEFILERIEPGEVVVHSNKLSFVPMFYYYESILPLRFVADFEGGGTDTLRLPTQEVLGFRESTSIEDAVSGAAGVWFIIYEKAIIESNEWGLGTHPHISWLDENLVLKEKIQKDSIWIMHYEADH